MDNGDVDDNVNTESVTIEKDWKRWSVEDVLQWIPQQPTFGKYVGDITRLFIEDEVDGEAIAMMTMKDLKACPVEAEEGDRSVQVGPVPAPPPPLRPLPPPTAPVLASSAS